MNILLLQDDPTVRERVAFVLDSQFKSTVLEADSPEAAKTILIDPKTPIQLIIVDCAPKESEAYDKLRAEFSEIQSLVFVRGAQEKRLAISAPPGHPVPMFIDRGDIVQNLITAMNGMIKRDLLPDPSKTDDDRNFCRIRTKLLLSVCPLKSDIYIRLSEAKYLKLMQQGDTFDMADMEKYTVKKGVEYLYLRTSEIGEFIRKFQDQLLNHLEKKNDLTMEDVAKVNDSVFETIQSVAAGVGFTAEVQTMARTQINMTMKAMGKSPRLSKIFDKINSYKGKYIASHSTLTGYLACSIASQMQWGSETTFHKLTLASFLHDIALSNHELAACSTLEQAQEGKFTDVERKAFKNHTMAGADIARQFHEVPPDVDVIIAQHHERPDGTGFPRTLAASYIAPLSAIFIVAHDMAKFALDRGDAFKVEDFLAAYRDQYKPSQFRKVVQGIESLI